LSASAAAVGFSPMGIGGQADKYYTGDLDLWGKENACALVLVIFFLPYLLIAGLC